MSIVGGGDAADEADAEHSEPQEEAETECGREVGGVEAGRAATPPVLEAKAAVVGAAGRRPGPEGSSGRGSGQSSDSNTRCRAELGLRAAAMSTFFDIDWSLCQIVGGLLGWWSAVLAGHGTNKRLILD